jgi:hypothetical protein
MTGVPGLTPMHGDAVQLTTNTAAVTITGNITSQGVLREDRGLVELTLPDADPQQRRDLERARWFQYRLFHGGTLLYASPHLTLDETRRANDGALIVAGHP